MPKLLIMSNIYEQQSFSLTSITSPDASTSSSTTYSTISIKRMLLNDDIHFKVVPNNSKRTKATYWEMFGFPAVFNQDDLSKYDFMPGFVSYKSCFDTYKYINSSIANLYSHRCCQEEFPDQMSIMSFIRSLRPSTTSSRIFKKKGC